MHWGGMKNIENGGKGGHAPGKLREEGEGAHMGMSPSTLPSFCVLWHPRARFAVFRTGVE